MTSKFQQGDRVVVKRGHPTENQRWDENMSLCLGQRGEVGEELIYGRYRVEPMSTDRNSLLFEESWLVLESEWYAAGPPALPAWTEGF